jgi:hypothetical protein
MTFREWLPITGRNRVALCLAALALLLFVVWNCLPNYHYKDTKPHGIVATSLWPAVIKPSHYITVFKSPNIQSCLAIAAWMALIPNAFVTLAAVPFWKLLHASSYIRLPLACVNFFDCTVWLLLFFRYGHDDLHPKLVFIFSLKTLSMFTLSAALFVFKNELAQREEKKLRDLTGKGGVA